MSDYEDYTDEELDAMYEAARKNTTIYKFRELKEAVRGCAFAGIDDAIMPPIVWIKDTLVPALREVTQWYWKNTTAAFDDWRKTLLAAFIVGVVICLLYLR